MTNARLFLFGVAGGLLLSVGASCDVGLCQRGECPGCCDTRGVCLLGDSESHCGDNGAACAVCAETDYCGGSPRSCTNNTNNTNHGTGSGQGTGTGGAAGVGGGGFIDCGNGCMVSGRCLRPPESQMNTSCGLSGGPCQDCSGFGSVCSNGTCVGSTGGIDSGVPPQCGAGCRRADGSCAQAPSNTMDSSCGAAGQACADCAYFGYVCRGYACQPPGTGGGTGSGGGTGAGGATGTCQQFATLNTPAGTVTRGFHQVDAGFGLWSALVPSPTRLANAALPDGVLIQRRSFAGAAVPFPSTATITSASWAGCQDCIAFGAGCDLNASVCVRRYVGRSGTLQYSIGIDTGTSGEFAGAAQNVHFVEWDMTSDAPAAGGGCLDVGTVSWHATWP